MSHYRTCNTIEINNFLNKEVTLCGWVHRRRDHGGVIFIDLRDRSGYCQVVFRSEISSEEHGRADLLRNEFVVMIKGKVILRTEENINPNMINGELEVEALSLELLSKSETPVFSLDEKEEIEVHEEIRLKYRYLDMRRQRLKTNLIFRHRYMQQIRALLNNENFLEIETPILNKTTPEGARDFIVPSRLNKNMCYALPQSPQIFKQILQIGGLERYYQIVKCFRDEDLRADRQPEFTQIDLEMSFMTQNEIMSLAENVIMNACKNIFSNKFTFPESAVPRMTYKEAIENYGSDKPDLRFDMKIKNPENACMQSEFQVFKKIKENGGIIRAVCVPEGDKLSRKDIDDATEYVKTFGAKGLAWMRMTESGLESNIVKFFSDACQKDIISVMQALPGNIIFFVADKAGIVYPSLGNLRLLLAKKLGMTKEKELKFLWVYDFPLFEYDEKEKRYNSVHHPFTMPLIEDVHEFDKDVLKIRSQAYDFVLNGSELGGGSVRISTPEVQKKVFSVLGIDELTAENKFGFLLTALKYGTPPHGGIAFGLDRILMIMLEQQSIRDVIAFPKTQRGICLMSGSPSDVSEDQLHELNFKFNDSAD